MNRSSSFRIIRTFSCRTPLRRCNHNNASLSGSKTSLSNPGPDSSEFEELTRPTWSVNALLQTYAAPSLPASTLEKLHILSALSPPPPNTPEFAQLQSEMSELIRLVEAVKLVDTSGVDGSDGRIWPRGRGIDLEVKKEGEAEEREILKHASRTKDGYYVVDSPPSGRSR